MRTEGRDALVLSTAYTTAPAAVLRVIGASGKSDEEANSAWMVFLSRSLYNFLMDRHDSFTLAVRTVRRTWKEGEGETRVYL